MEERQLFQIQAELCQAVGNPLRLQIIHILRQEGACVNDISKRIGISQSNVSRHLTILRTVGLVVAHRQGSNVIYYLANPKIVAVCDMMREIISQEFERLAGILEAKPSNPQK